MHALEIGGPDGQVHRFVVRRHGAAQWKPLAHDVTTTEFALMQALREVGLAAPEVCFFDDSGDVFPSPYLVMKFVAGTTSVGKAALPEALLQMASYLARLHAIDVDNSGLPTLPAREDPVEGCLKYLPPGAWADPLRSALSNSAASRPIRCRSLLHGDFWPQNILWRDNKIAAVLDWEDAALGDPLSDLAGCRVELLCHYDKAAMHAFTAHYLALANVEPVNQLVWDVYVSSAAAATMGDWGLAPEVEAKRRKQTDWFLRRAARELLSQLTCGSLNPTGRGLEQSNQ